MSAKVLSNLESIGDMIGHLKGISVGLEEDDYIAGVIRQAHGETANLFNVAAAATAGTGRLSHVYEYGVPGITPGPTKFPDPTAPAARLWTHTITGRGGQQDIGYLFRPATQPNPQPTTASTGVPSKYLAKLSKRKHVFWNRALVTETGRTVTIKPKNASRLFVPFYGNPARAMAKNGKPVVNDRGFAMTRGPVFVTPGENKNMTGQFTALWMTWWGSAGAEAMEERMRASVGLDIEKAEAAMTASVASKSSQMKPPTMVNLPGAISKAAGESAKKFGALRKAWKGRNTQ